MTITVSEYLLAPLKENGVEHVFGIPEDFILPFLPTMATSDVEHVAPVTLMSETLRSH